MKLEYRYFSPDDGMHIQPFLAHSNPVGDNPVGDNPVGDNPVGDNPVGDNPVGDNPVLQRKMGTGVCRASNLPLNCAVNIGTHAGLGHGHYQQTICVEPHKENAECLCKDLEGRNAIIYPFGFSETATQKSFCMPSDARNSHAGT